MEGGGTGMKKGTHWFKFLNEKLGKHGFQFPFTESLNERSRQSFCVHIGTLEHTLS